MITSIRLRTLTLALAVVAILSPAVSSGDPGGKSPSSKANAPSSNAYIVRLIDAPVVAYDGSVSGYRATKPGKGKKIDPNSPDVARYAAHLDGKHNAALAAAGGGRKLYSYRYTFNGFAAEMTDAQAQKLKSLPGVISVEKDVLVEMDTSTTPTFLGLDALGGLWDQLGGKGSAGEDIIVGIIDSGIWPESVSFSDRVDKDGNPSAGGSLAYHHIPGWHGKCNKGEAIKVSDCNQKLIGGQHFNVAWGGDAGIDALRPWEFNSVRDYNGHGTHTASTAGGNHGVQATGPAAPLGKISGMAPRARIAAYKALWSTQSGSQASGLTSDLVAAIDQAVADGVDVINYSISGTQTNFADPVEIAFLFAADAGVFVATSAGNSGPGFFTVAHPGPWLTTVAAGTHNRNGAGATTLGNGVTYNGASFASALASKSLVDSVAVPASGVPAANAELCLPGTLNATAVAGKVVLCKRGVNALVEKSLTVFQAGGVGMLLYNDPAGGTNTLALIHSVPAVHVVATDGLAIKTYIASAAAGATASIAQSQIVLNTPAPTTASFSSRGPLLAGGGDLLKPDVIAPGQDILAAVAPPANAGLDFNLYSGTSMSSPHVAGLAALLKDKYPSWSPMMIKSALMTSGSDLLGASNTSPSVIFQQGAGHVRPNKAADPGLVFDHGFNDWLAFLCGTTTAVNPASCAALSGAGFSLDPSDLNVASIAIGAMAGVQTVKRKVTNVSGARSTYNLSVAGLAGFDVAVSPSSFTLGPGQSQTIAIAFTRTTAALNTFAGGQVTWSDGGIHSVRIPVVIVPVALAAPAQVSNDYTVTFGYTGAFTAAPRGLIPAALTAGTVADDPTDSVCSLASPNAVHIQVSIPAGTTYTRFSLFDADVSPGADIDTCLFLGATQVGGSGSGTSAEEMNLVNPAAGVYTVVVQGWGVAGSSPFKLHTWLLDSTATGNMTVGAPATAVLGAAGTIDLTFSGLTAGTKYLGSVAYSGVAGLPNPTIVRVDP